MFLEKFTKWNLLHPGCMYVTWTSTEILNWGRWKVYKWWKTLVPSVSHKPSEVNLCITHNLLGTMLVICSFGEWPKKSHLFVVVLTPIILIKKKVWIWGQPSTCIQGWRGSTTPLTLWWKQYFKKKQREAGLNQQQSVFGGLAFTSKLGVGRSQNWHDNHVSLS